MTAQKLNLCHRCTSEAFVTDAPVQRSTSAEVLLLCSDPLADQAALQEGNNAAILVGTPGRLMDMLRRCDFLDTRLLEVGPRSAAGQCCRLLCCWANSWSCRHPGGNPWAAHRHAAALRPPGHLPARGSPLSQVCCRAVLQIAVLSGTQLVIPPYLWALLGGSWTCCSVATSWTPVCWRSA